MSWASCSGENLRLTFKVFHNIQEFVVYFWLVRELDLDLIQICESILDVQGSVSVRLRTCCRLFVAWRWKRRWRRGANIGCLLFNFHWWFWDIRTRMWCWLCICGWRQVRECCVSTCLLHRMYTWAVSSSVWRDVCNCGHCRRRSTRSCCAASTLNTIKNQSFVWRRQFCSVAYPGNFGG